MASVLGDIRSNHLATGDRMSKTENHELIPQELKTRLFKRLRLLSSISMGSCISQRKVPVSRGWWFWLCDVVFGWDNVDVCYDNVKDGLA